MSSTTEKIKDRLSIVDVLSGYITLERAGGSLKARCPFHNEKTPSFFISPERNTYYCFGCGAKGDIFSFVQEFENLDFLGALKILAEKAGVEIESFQKDPQESAKSKIFACIEEATKFFQNELKKNSEALLYLKSRSLSIEMVRDWRIGFAPDDWHAVEHHLLKLGFTTRQIEDAGLTKQGEKGNQYARFRGRIMFPIFDGSGRVVAFSGRILKKDSEEAKYINSPETIIFEKSKVLYGYNAAKRAMREKNFTILVEGQMDLLMSHQAGFANTVASSGTAFTLEQAEIIKRLSDTILIAYDSDKAGQNAAFRAWRLALKAGLLVKAVALKEGMDPADAIKQDKSIWERAIEEAKDIIEHYAHMLEGKSKEESNILLKEKLLPLIASVDSSIDQARYIQMVSQKSGLPESALRDELAKIPREDIEVQSAKPEVARKITGIKKKAIALMWYAESKKSPESEMLQESIRKVMPKLDQFLETLSDDKESVLFEAEMHYANSPNLSAVINDTLFFLEDEILKEKFAETMEKLKRAESKGDKSEIEKITKECHQLSIQLSELKSKHFNK
ncbi:MAG TPA: DNA primase [Candidatus Paceibacterota bacterium]|nr:DNA primase [Candidatus Paceibacterota bacterium]